ncbi:hypothetical protein, partial [Escherichia coli]|uniref:hypothetical protein n=1 Tax=Escherichia coli TaxID=562 RepID=UPI001F436F41
MIAHDNKKARHFAGFVFFCCLVIFTDGLFDILMVFIEQNNGSPTIADRKTFTRSILRVI